MRTEAWGAVRGGDDAFVDASRAAERREQERVEAALLAYAHRAASRWGAERFAAEFHRRNDEEQRFRQAEERVFGPADNRLDAAWEDALFEATRGPVDSDVSVNAVEAVTDDLALRRPMRHAHVPRPPTEAPSLDRVRPWRRRRRAEQRSEPSQDAMWTITTAEATRMSPGARRLYGIQDQPTRRPR